MPKTQNNLDSQNIHSIIENLPNQFKNAFAEVNLKLTAKDANIVFCGMGGSALPADLFLMLLPHLKESLKQKFIINKNYSLPAEVDENWIGIFNSYSGNTEETLATLQEAKKIGLKQIIIFAHDGELKRIAEQNNYAYISIPDTKQPRLAYGYTIGALLKIMHDSGCIALDYNQLNQSIEKALAQNIDLLEVAEDLATDLNGKIPLIYTDTTWQALAMVWKINFNENAKTQSFYNVFPELNHNEMVGFTDLLADYQIIILQDNQTAERNKKRMQVFQNILGNKIATKIITMPGDDAFDKFLQTLSLGLWTSYRLAINKGIDPAPVELVEHFKKQLK